MEPRMYHAEPSLVMNAERSGPKPPLCPSCAQNMRLISKNTAFRRIARRMHVWMLGLWRVSFRRICRRNPAVR